MKKMIAFLFPFLIVLNLLWVIPLHSLILEQNVSEHRKKIGNMSNENLLKNIKNYNFGYQNVHKGKITFSTTIIDNDAASDTLELGSILYVPDSYDYKNETPLIVYLHGGISLQEPRNVEEWDITTNEFYLFLKEKGWFGFFPTGKINYTWWDDPGMENLTLQINCLRTKYNIDSVRIYLTGVSDGGSGSYAFAALQPNQFASFFTR